MQKSKRMSSELPPLPKVVKQSDLVGPGKSKANKFRF
jgi:hypothetical protein